MKKKAIRSVVFIALLVVVAYNAVYFRKLDAVKAASTSRQFDAVAYANHFFDQQLLPGLSRAVDITLLLQKLQSSPVQAFRDHSHALGIGNIRYFLVKGSGTITAINENDVSIGISNDRIPKEVKIATEFVYGNAIRDASGLISLNEFTSTMDFNNVSAEINKIVRHKVLPAFTSAAKPGMMVRFSGALELNQAHVNTDHIEIIPVTLELMHDPKK